MSDDVAGAKNDECDTNCLRVKLKRLTRVIEELLEERLPILPSLEAKIREVRHAIALKDPDS